MRPVERGETPLDDAGQVKRFRKYQSARHFLIERIGYYCSYCEVYMRSGLAVEHLKPKVLHHNLIVEWDNFLLSCPNCNSTKGRKKIVVENLAWPHRDNTFLMLEYQPTGEVFASASLMEFDHVRVYKLIELLQLNREFKNKNELDVRWEDRKIVWELASGLKLVLETLSDNEVLNFKLREQIVKVAIGKGLWSIWMTVFQDDLDMKRRLIEAFPGTALQCFDNDCNAIPRP